MLCELIDAHHLSRLMNINTYHILTHPNTKRSIYLGQRPRPALDDVDDSICADNSDKLGDFTVSDEQLRQIITERKLTADQLQSVLVAAKAGRLQNLDQNDIALSIVNNIIQQRSEEELQTVLTILSQHQTCQSYCYQLYSESNIYQVLSEIVMNSTPVNKQLAVCCLSNFVLEDFKAREQITLNLEQALSGFTFTTRAWRWVLTELCGFYSNDFESDEAMTVLEKCVHAINEAEPAYYDSNTLKYILEFVRRRFGIHFVSESVNYESLIRLISSRNKAVFYELIELIDVCGHICVDNFIEFIEENFEQTAPIKLKHIYHSLQFYVEIQNHCLILFSTSDHWLNPICFSECFAVICQKVNVSAVEFPFIIRCFERFLDLNAEYFGEVDNKKVVMIEHILHLIQQIDCNLVWQMVLGRCGEVLHLYASESELVRVFLEQM